MAQESQKVKQLIMSFLRIVFGFSLFDLISFDCQAGQFIYLNLTTLIFI